MTGPAKADAADLPGFYLHPRVSWTGWNVFLQYSLSIYSFTFISLSNLSFQFISLPQREDCYCWHKQKVCVKISTRISIGWWSREMNVNEWIEGEYFKNIIHPHSTEEWVEMAKAWEVGWVCFWWANHWIWSSRSWELPKLGCLQGMLWRIHLHCSDGPQDLISFSWEA